MRRLGATVALAAAALASRPTAALAHGFEPALLRLVEREPGRFDVTWKVPLADAESGLGELGVEPALPDHCLPLGEPREAAGGTLRVWTVDCAPLGLAGRTVRFPGLEASSTEVLVRVTAHEGGTFATVVRPSEALVVLPGGASGAPLEVATSYAALGVEHILSGPDHLLFVLGLLLLLLGRRLLLMKTVTAFTAGHSVTLALATLDLVRVPSAPVEAVIALSILLLATELLREKSESLTLRRPWAVALAFGLLHGLGFAGALAEVGVPRTQLPVALAAFNVGVEAGQLLFVGAVLALIGAARRLPAALRPARARALAAWGIGAVAAFWSAERIAAFWA